MALLREPTAASAGLLTTGIAEIDALGGGTVFLRPGDWFFGRGTLRVTTLLGSCVALVLWSPRWRLGAMCHCLLPERPRELMRSEGLDGRYGDEAGAWLVQRFQAAGCSLADLEASVAGGASSGDSGIGDANIAWAQRFAAAQGLRFMQQDVGGRVVRRLAFNVSDGSLTVAHGGRLGPQEPTR